MREAKFGIGDVVAHRFRPFRGVIFDVDPPGTGSNTASGTACTFQTNLCGWNQDKTDKFDWTRHYSGTSSTGTGPSSGAGGHGYYMYIETSSPRVQGDTAALVSSTRGCGLSFDYHMLGTDIGKLEVHSSDNGRQWTSAWVKTGAQGSKWLTASVTTSTGSSSKLWRVTATRGKSYGGDIAIDNLGIIACTAAPACTVHDGICS